MSCLSCDTNFDPIPTDPKDFEAYAKDMQRQIQELNWRLKQALREKYRETKERFVALTKPVSLFNEPECTCDIEDDFEEIDKSCQENDIKPPRRSPRKLDLSKLEVASETIHQLKGKDRCCSGCQEIMAEIGEEETRRLEIIPAKSVVHKDIYKKYACKNDQCIDGQVSQAKAPMRAVPKVLATKNTLAFIAAKKYQYSLPLYRLETMTEEMGHKINRSTMASWMMKVSDALKPVYEALERQLIARDYLHIDETRVQVLKEPGRKAENQSFAWVRCSGDESKAPIILFHYSPSRSGAIASQLLSGFKGYVQSDDYAGYSSALKGNSDVQRLVCWDHARRYFIKAHDAIPKKNRKGTLAYRALGIIQQLYAVEKAKDKESLHDLRQTKSKALLQNFKELLESEQAALSSHSLTSKAISYTLDNWILLNVYLEDPRLNISNAPAERAIRPFVIGRKNWIFSDTPRGANASMVIYSLVITAKANGLDPMKYLAETLRRIPRANTAEALAKLMPLKSYL